jgi:hypothetical protein
MAQVVPKGVSDALPSPAELLQCTLVVEKIHAHPQGMDQMLQSQEGKRLHYHLNQFQLHQAKCGARSRKRKEPMAPSDNALKSYKKTNGTRAGKQLLAAHEIPVATPDRSKQFFTSTCYQCKIQLTKSHEQYKSMCLACGNLNADKRMQTSPNLQGKTAVVTGGRIKIGFETALKLLRCGARVIISTRYAQDADKQYRKQSDYVRWSERLTILAADFRSIP